MPRRNELAIGIWSVELSLRSPALKPTRYQLARLKALGISCGNSVVQGLTKNDLPLKRLPFFSRVTDN